MPECISEIFAFTVYNCRNVELGILSRLTLSKIFVVQISLANADIRKALVCELGCLRKARVERVFLMIILLKKSNGKDVIHCTL